jgi:hypothetical protein
MYNKERDRRLSEGGQSADLIRPEGAPRLPTRDCAEKRLKAGAWKTNAPKQGAAMARQWLALNRVRAVLALAERLAALKALSLPE